MRVFSVTLVAFAPIACARWTNNINYRSPSEHHPFMGIAIHKVVRRSNYDNPFNASQLNFTHGVASGDPYPDSVILWTRCSPQYEDVDSNVTVSGTAPLFNHYSSANVSVSTAPVCVDWQISTSPEIGDIVNSGRAYTSSDIDYTIKVGLHYVDLRGSLMWARSRQISSSHSLNTTTGSASATRRTIAR